MSTVSAKTYEEYYRLNGAVAKTAITTVRGLLANLGTAPTRLAMLLRAAFRAHPGVPLAVGYDLNDGEGAKVAVRTGLFQHQDNPLLPGATGEHDGLLMVE